MARNVAVANLFYRLEADAKGLEAEIGRSEKSLGRLSKFILANPVAALAGMAAAATAAALKFSEMAAEFEIGMARVNTVAQVSERELSGLSDGVLALFGSLPIATLGELTSGLYDVVSAGVPAGQALDVLRIAAEAAVGGTTDVATAVSGLTKAVNVFADDGLTAKDAADTLFVGVRKGITTFEQLANTVGVVGPSAKALGVSFQDLTAAEAALTTKGVETAAAATGLRAVFANLLRPTEELEKVYPELAKQFNVTALETKGLGGFLNDLAPIVLQNRDAAVKMFGSTEALNVILALTGDGGATLNTILGEMAGRTGEADKAFQQMLGTTEAQAQVLRNQINVQMIELGTQVLPIVNQGLNAMHAVLSLIFGFARDQHFDALGKQLVAIGDNLAFLRPGTASMTSALADLDDVIKTTTARGATLQLQLRKLADGALPGYKLALERALDLGNATVDQQKRYQTVLDLVNTEIEKRGIPLHQEVEKVIKRTTTATTAGGTATVTAENRKVQASRISKRVAEEALALAVVSTAELTEKHIPAIGKLEGKNKELQAAIERVKKASDDWFDAQQAGADQAEADAEQQLLDIQSIVTGIGGMASGLGIVSDKAANVAVQIGNIATNIGAALGGDISSIGAVLGSLTGVLGALFSGSGPQEKLLRTNNERLQELARVNGELLDLQISGRDFSGIQDALEAAFGLDPGNKGVRALLGEELVSRGLSLGDVKDLAETLGIDLGSGDQPLLPALLQLLEALQKDVEFSKFGDTVKGQRSFISAAISTGAKDKSDEFGLLAGLAGQQGITAITDLLTQFDPTSTEGRAGLLTALRDVILQLNEGTIDPAAFGGASGPEFLALVSDLISILSDPDRTIGAFSLPTTPDAPEVAFSVGQSIETSLDNVLGPASTAVGLLEQIAGNTALLAPPPLALLRGEQAQALGGLLVDLGGVVVNVQGGADPAATGAATAIAVRDAVAGALDEYLARQLTLAQQAAGSAARA